MAKNVKAVYDANPSTTKGVNDLSYVGKSPYGTSNDSAIKYSDELAQLNAEIQLPSTAKVTGLVTALGLKANADLSNVSGTLGKVNGGTGIAGTPTIGKVLAGTNSGDWAIGTYDSPNHTILFGAVGDGNVHVEVAEPLPASPLGGSLLMGFSDNTWNEGDLISSDGNITIDKNDGTIDINVDGSSFVNISGNQTILGIKTFTDGVFFTKTGEANYSDGQTISASDMGSKIITASSIAPVVVLPPTGADFDGYFQIPPINTIIPILFVNFGTGLGSLSIGNNSGFTVGGVANVTIPANSPGRFFWARKTAANTFILYG